jgi:hypothetical protein
MKKSEVTFYSKPVSRESTNLFKTTSPKSANLIKHDQSKNQKFKLANNDNNQAFKLIRTRLAQMHYESSHTPNFFIAGIAPIAQPDLVAHDFQDRKFTRSNFEKISRSYQNQLHSSKYPHNLSAYEQRSTHLLTPSSMNDIDLETKKHSNDSINFINDAHSHRLLTSDTRNSSMKSARVKTPFLSNLNSMEKSHSPTSRRKKVIILEKEESPRVEINDSKKKLQDLYKNLPSILTSTLKKINDETNQPDFFLNYKQSGLSRQVILNT